jgi:hypothetical protein
MTINHKPALAMDFSRLEWCRAPSRRPANSVISRQAPCGRGAVPPRRSSSEPPGSTFNQQKLYFRHSNSVLVPLRSACSPSPLRQRLSHTVALTYTTGNPGVPVTVAALLSHENEEPVFSLLTPPDLAADSCRRVNLLCWSLRIESQSS